MDILKLTDDEIFNSPSLLDELSKELENLDLPPLSCRTCRGVVQTQINIIRNKKIKVMDQKFITKSSYKIPHTTKFYNKYNQMPDLEAAVLCLKHPQFTKKGLLFSQIPTEQEILKIAYGGYKDLLGNEINENTDLEVFKKALFEAIDTKKEIEKEPSKDKTPPPSKEGGENKITTNISLKDKTPPPTQFKK